LGRLFSVPVSEKLVNGAVQIVMMKILLAMLQILVNQALLSWALPQGMPRLPTFWFMSPLLLEDLGSQESYQVELPDSSKLMFAYGRFCRAECDGPQDSRRCTKICTVCTEDGCDTRKDVFDPAKLQPSGGHTSGPVHPADNPQDAGFYNPADNPGLYNSTDYPELYNPADNPGLYKEDFPYDPALNPGLVNPGTQDVDTDIENHVDTDIENQTVFESIYDTQSDDYNAYLAATHINGEDSAALLINGKDTAAADTSGENYAGEASESATLEPELTTTEVPETTTPALALKWPEIKEVKEKKPVRHGHRKYSSFGSKKFSF